VLKPNTLGGVSTMASRLYPTTRRLFQQVMQHVKVIGLGAVLSPLVLALVALYVTGLLLLDRRQTGTRIADWLPGRAHDALNRLVRHVAFVLIALVILQRLRLHPKETLGEVKDRLQRELITGGLPAPRPLRGKVALAQLLTAQVLLVSNECDYLSAKCTC
jgi:hypothetical protein